MIAERLSEAIKGHGDKAMLADATGVSRAAVSRWASGLGIEGWHRLREICEALGLSADYILGLSDIPDLPTFTIPDPDGFARQYKSVPILESEVCAGPGAEMTEEPDGFHAMQEDWLLGNIQGRAARVRVSRAHHLGESMANTILPGAVLTVDMRQIHAEEIEPYTGIYLIRDGDNGVMVKRVVPDFSRKVLICISDNQAFPKFEIDPKDGGSVIGKVLRWEQGETKNSV